MEFENAIDDSIPMNNENKETQIKLSEDKLNVKIEEAKNLKEELNKLSKEFHGSKFELIKTHSSIHPLLHAGGGQFDHQFTF